MHFVTPRLQAYHYLCQCETSNILLNSLLEFLHLQIVHNCLPPNSVCLHRWLIREWRLCLGWYHLLPWHRSKFYLLVSKVSFSPSPSNWSLGVITLQEWTIVAGGSLIWTTSHGKVILVPNSKEEINVKNPFREESAGLFINFARLCSLSGVLSANSIKPSKLLYHQPN